MAKKTNIVSVSPETAPAYEALRILKANGYRLVKFPVHPSQLDVSFEELGLSARACNALMRAGFRTGADIAENFSGSVSLTALHQLGKTSALEVVMALFIYQYSVLPENKKTDYLVRVARLTMGK